MVISICHDSNHNGDDFPDKGCGNPECWKHQPGNSPEPKTIKVYSCSHCYPERWTEANQKQAEDRFKR